MNNPPALAISGVSDPGRVRDHNEDAIRWDVAGGWAILADGMGGHLAGEVASALAIDTIAGCLAAFGSDEPGEASEALQQAVAAANRTIHDQALADIRCHNMGTTVVVALFRDDMLSCAHVGDSRLYRFNADGLALLSHDHSLVQELVDEGFISREEAATSVHKNVITRALGLQGTVEADVLQLPVASGDLFLLCSDGLSDKIPDDDLARFLSDDDLDCMVQALVDEANARGGEDNISAILVRIG